MRLLSVKPLPLSHLAHSVTGASQVQASAPQAPKHAENENPRNHHNDEQRDDALREIRIFRHCLVPLNPAD